MAYAPSICRGDPEWRGAAPGSAAGARAPHSLPGLAHRLPCRSIGAAWMLQPSDGPAARWPAGLRGVAQPTARVFLALKKEKGGRVGREKGMFE